MVGTTRFELATSPTPILETTQSEQLSDMYQYVRERETTRRNAYWTRNGPTVGPTLVYAIKNAARTATSAKSVVVEGRVSCKRCLPD
jgi:hypothetical protein